MVSSIPPGRVATYGGVAALAGRPGAARAVGSILSALDADSDLPWWRVVGSGGRITTRRTNRVAQLQRAILADEGVPVEERGSTYRVRWAEAGWEGPESEGPVADRPGKG